MKKLIYLIVAIVALSLIVAGCTTSVVPPAEQDETSSLTKGTFGSTIYVDSSYSGVGDGQENSPFTSIQVAIDAATDGDTIKVAAGIYVEVGQIFIDKDLSIDGEDETTTIIKPAQNTGQSIYGSDDRAWFYITTGTTFNFSNVTLDGTGRDICRAIVVGSNSQGGGDGCIHNIIIRNMFTTASGDGVGIATYGNLTRSNSTFFNIHRTPIFVVGDSPGGAIVEVSYNTIIGKGDVTDALDNGIELGWDAYAYIHHNTVSNCRGVVGSWKSVAIYVHHDASADIRDNTINNNANGIVVGYYDDPSDISTVSANFNNIVGNTDYGVNNKTSVPIDATCNWWGDFSGPFGEGSGSGDTVSENVGFYKWLLSPAPDAVCYSWYGFDEIVACATNVKNHGQFVSCVSHLTKDWLTDELITAEDKAAITKWAAQSDIGKK